MRTLRHAWPAIEVHADVRALDGIEPGSTLVLVPRAEDADYLNQRRQLFAERRLKVVLWCDEATTVALARGAVDLYDWISHRQTCPPGPPPFAVRGLRAAFEVGWPVVWQDADPPEVVEEVVRAATGEARVVWVEGSVAYERVLETLKEPAIVGIRVSSARQLRRARWAIAEARRSSRVILVAPGLECPGFWPVRTRFVDLASAGEALASASAGAGEGSSLRLAALLDLEPKAISHAKALLEGPVFYKRRSLAEVEAAAVEEMDPAVGLARLLDRTRKLRLHEPIEPILLRDDSLVLRGVARQTARKASSEWVKAMGKPHDIFGLQQLPEQRGPAALAAHAPPQWWFDEDWAREPRNRTWALEATLHSKDLNGADWTALAVAAATLGEVDVASFWLRIHGQATRPPLSWIIVSVLQGSDPAARLARLLELPERFARAFARVRFLAIVQGSLGVVVAAASAALLRTGGGLGVAVAMGMGVALLAAGLGYGWLALSSRRATLLLQLLRVDANGLDRAQELLAKGDPIGAEKEAGSVLEEVAALGEEHPLYERAQHLQASLLLATTRSREALELVEPLFSPDRPISDDLALLTARILAAAGRAGDAVQVLARLTGTALSANGPLPPAGPTAPSFADPILERLLEHRAGALAESLEAHLALIDALLKQGRYPEALLITRAASERWGAGQDRLGAVLADLERRLGPREATPAR